MNTDGADKNKREVRPLKPRNYGSIRSRLSAIFVIVAAPLVILAGYLYVHERQMMIDHLRLSARVELAEIVRREGAILESTGILLDTIAQSPELRDGKWDACGSIFSSILHETDRYYNFTVFDPKGDLVCSGLPATGAINVADRSWFKDAVVANDLSVGDLVVSRLDKKTRTFTITHPIERDGGQIVGMSSPPLT
jgi:hypothetical protein